MRTRASLARMGALSGGSPTTTPPPMLGSANGKRVAVLGAGAAGLVASRLLREAGFSVRCFEKTDSVGGVWRYRCVGRSTGVITGLIDMLTGLADSAVLTTHTHTHRPEDVMYRSLVTNLPKEIMAFLDTPFDPALPVSLSLSFALPLGSSIRPS